jgi:hypothetical protein
MPLNSNINEKKKQRNGVQFSTLLFGLILLTIAFAFYLWHKKKTSRKELRNTKRLNDWSQIKTGDLCFTHWEGPFCNKMQDSVLYYLSGSRWTHVGIFVRNPRTNQLYVMEFADKGVRYSTLQNRFDHYPGSIGVRRLKNPLCATQLDNLHRIVNETLHFHNLITDESIQVYFKDPNGTQNHFRVANLDHEKPLVNYKSKNNSTSAFMRTCLIKDGQTSVVCTDKVFNLLERIDLLPKDPTKCYQCLNLNAFFEDRHINYLYHDVEMIKCFDYDHDIAKFPCQNYCQHDGTKHINIHTSKENSISCSGCSTSAESLLPVS